MTVGVVTMLAVGLLARPASARVARVPDVFGGGSFAVDCGVSHRAADDPILFPGLPARSHDHTFFGNVSTDAFSTDASLLAGETLCHRAADRSAYWVPTLLESGRPVRPLGASIYYLGRTVGRVEPLPPGLRMVAGDPRARAPQGIERVWWNCRWEDPIEAAVPVCPTGGDFGLRLHVVFPACWDGVRLDSADQSHMAYPVDGVCPADHPVAVPSIMLIVRYPVSGNEDLAFTSGSLDSAHADVFVAWRGEAQARLVDHCVNGRRDCEKLSNGPERCPLESVPEGATAEAPVSCPPPTTGFDDVSCRLHAIATSTASAPGLTTGTRTRLRSAARAAGRFVSRAARRCVRGAPSAMSASLDGALDRLSPYDAFFRSDRRRCAVPVLERSTLLRRAAQLLVDIDDVRRAGLRTCPVAPSIAESYAR